MKRRSIISRCMREEWRSAENWPPVETQQRLFLAPDQRLADVAPGAGEDDIKSTSRSAPAPKPATSASPVSTAANYYADWQGRTAKMLSYTVAAAREPRRSSPVTASPISGSPAASLISRCSSISPKSRPTAPSAMSPKGLLRALHRKERPAPENYRTTGRSARLRAPTPRRLCLARSSASAFRFCRSRGDFRPAAASACRSPAPTTIIADRSRMAGRRD